MKSYKFMDGLEFLKVDSTAGKTLEDEADVSLVNVRLLAHMAGIAKLLSEDHPVLGLAIDAKSVKGTVRKNDLYLLVSSTDDMVGENRYPAVCDSNYVGVIGYLVNEEQAIMHLSM